MFEAKMTSVFLPGKCQDGRLNWAMTAFFHILSYAWWS
jgi:hypothetical protein